MRWLMILLRWIAIVLSGLGTIVIIIATIARLTQQGFTRELWLILGGLSLVAVGAIGIVISVYNEVEFSSFALIMVSVLILISIAFSILGRIRV